MLFDFIVHAKLHCFKLRLRKIKELHLGVAMKITMRDSSPVLDIM
jgi:hypothetical protein